MDYQLEGQEVIINCGTQLTIESVQLQKQILLDALNTNKTIIFRSDEVSQVDTAALQLLLSFVLSASHKNLQWHWESPSSQLMYVATLLGVRELLGLPQK